MSWVDAASYADAEPDPLRPHAERIIAHMNDDHADALVLFCRRFAERPDTTEARMVAVDRYGFAVLAADEPGGRPTAVRLPFDERTDTPDGVRKAMIELLRRAREH
jgi:putative heme iron utilization protein